MSRAITALLLLLNLSLSPAASAAAAGAVARSQPTQAQGTMGKPLTGSAAAPVAGPAAGEAPTVVVLVRHAEKASAADDTPLSAAGRQRATELARVLKDADITAVLTTPFRRTQETAAPLAANRGLTPQLLSNDRSNVRAQVLNAVTPGAAPAAPRRVLIVGHSNTVPPLIAALGGPSDVAIADNEFDGLFILTIPAQGPATLVTVRYGAPPTL